MSLLSVLELPALTAHAAIEDEGDLHGLHARCSEGLGLTLPFVHLEVSLRRAFLMPDLLSAAGEQKYKKITHRPSLGWLETSSVVPAAHFPSLVCACLPESCGRNFPAGSNFPCARFATCTSVPAADSCGLFLFS
jgi:hypothetical protein